MNTTTFLLKLFLDAFRDTIKVCKYFKLYSYNGLFIPIRIFLIKFLFSFSKFRNLIKPNTYNFKNNFGSNNKYLLSNDLNLLKIVSDIENQGYSQQFMINNSTIEKIIEESLKNGFFDRNKLNQKIKNEELTIFNSETINQYIERLSKLGISRLTKTLDLKNDNLILNKLIFSDEIINVARSYLNTNKLSVNAMLFITSSIKITENEKFQNAQYFHWDNDFTKFFKLYIYLNDVNDHNGPHVFVPNTHKIKKKEHRLCRLYSDENILKNYPNIKTFLGKKGTAFFVDSYGIHKGKTPKKNYRLMLNIHFGRGKILYSKNDRFINLN
jgi:ectoine hydroxylase-related dioxygenase (phytanoyl-CoA dioxygenase family)